MGAAAAKPCCCSCSNPHQGDVQFSESPCKDPQDNNVEQVDNSGEKDEMDDMKILDIAPAIYSRDLKAEEMEPEEEEEREPQQEEDGKSAAQAFARFNGYWKRSDDKPAAHIKNGTLRWRESEDLYRKGDVRVKVNEDGELLVDVDGVALTGQMYNGWMIMWSDGDSWERDENGESIVKYNGTWCEDDKALANIWEGSMKWIVPEGKKVQDGVETVLKVTDSGRIEMIMNGETYTGEIVDGALIWSDGLKWTKKL